MTEEELMAKRCPHLKRTGDLSTFCCGSACSQYREKPAPAAQLNQHWMPHNSPVKLDMTVWKLNHTSPSGDYYSRIDQITGTNAWCGLAGVPHYAE